MIDKVKPNEKRRLRELAKRQLSFASEPHMEELRRRHWELNNLVNGTLPVVRIETDNYISELVPENLLECETPFARNIERQLLYYLRHYELTGDDMIIPKTFQMEWTVHIDRFGFPIKRETAVSGTGHRIGYKTVYAIKSISRDFHKLKPLTASVDRTYTNAYRTAIEELIGDILPVEMIGWPKGVTFLTRNLLDLMSMEDFYIAMLDEPDEVHRIMEYLLNNAFILMEFYERERIMYVNNGAVDLGNSSYPFTDQLPAADYQGVPRLKDMFLRTDSQETVGISPAMFNEFCLPYYKRLCQRAGLWYYGCCEPVHPIWEGSLSQIKNIKKVSISKWCDEEIMGQHLLNSGIVYSRKLDPLFLGADSGLDAEGLAASIRKTMKYAGGCQIEFLSREVATLYGNTAKLRTAVDIIRREIADALGSYLP